MKWCGRVILDLILAASSFGPIRVGAAPGFVDKEDFLSVKKGCSLAEIRNDLGNKLYHGFTVQIGSNVWTLAVCRVSVSRVESGLESYMLFRNGVFHGFANEITGYSDSDKDSRYPLFGMTDSHQHFTAEPKDASSLGKLVQRPFSQTDYEGEYEKLLAWGRGYHGDVSLALVPLMIPALALSPIWMPPTGWDYYRNWSLKKRIDGFDVDLGGPETNVVTKLGHLVERKSFKSGVSVMRFGRGDYDWQIPRRHECPDLIVVSSNGLVRAVYSDFSGWW